MKVSSYSELEKALADATKKAMQKSSEEQKKRVEQAIDSKVYNAYSPTEYARTRQLVGSLEVETKNTGKGAITKIGHDVSKTYYPSAYGDSYAYNLPHIVHEGLAGKIFPPLTASFYKPRRYMDLAQEWLKDGEEVKKAFKQMGYKVV